MDEIASLRAAQSGGEAAFRDLVSGHERELLVHCYRMLGSMQDAEDALQDSLLRAWQALGAFEGRSSIRTWLYKIATNVCLDAIDRRKARVAATALSPAGDPTAPMPAPLMERVWIEPMSDERLVAGEAGPDARLAARESVALAFLAMLQSLPGRQRAALVLRDVLGFSANETADTLEMSVAAVNSALQRARETLEASPPSSSLDPNDPIALDLVGRFVRAWEAADTAALVLALRSDAILAMPPIPLWLAGRDAIAAFLARTVLRAPGVFKTYITRANGCPAVAMYQKEEKGEGYRFAALEVIEVASDGIRQLTSFLAIDSSLTAKRLGVPETL